MNKNYFTNQTQITKPAKPFMWCGQLRQNWSANRKHEIHYKM